MNPFLFKAHPLLHATVSLLTGAEAFSAREALTLLVTYLAINLPPAVVLVFRVRKSVQIRLRFTTAYLFALPATVLYTPIALTLLRDVARHAFQLQDRYLLLFALLVATVLLAALLGMMVRYRNGDPVGSETGLILALTLFFAYIPYGLLLLGLDRLFDFFPAS